MLTGKGIEVGHFLLETALNTEEKGFIIQKPCHTQAFNLRQKWVAGVRQLARSSSSIAR